VKGKGRRVGRDFEGRVATAATVRVASAESVPCLAVPVPEVIDDLHDQVSIDDRRSEKNNQRLMIGMMAGLHVVVVVRVYTQILTMLLTNSDRPIIHSWQHSRMLPCFHKILEIIWSTS